jgi:hypothetical protein
MVEKKCRLGYGCFIVLICNGCEYSRVCEECCSLDFKRLIRDSRVMGR